MLKIHFPPRRRSQLLRHLSWPLLPRSCMSLLADSSTTLSDHWLVESLLREQRELPAVEQFSHWHEDLPPQQVRSFRGFVPLFPPGPGERCAFEVDLDACSGCKACVTACHSLNGLDEE